MILKLIQRKFLGLVVDKNLCFHSNISRAWGSKKKGYAGQEVQMQDDLQDGQEEQN